MKTGTLEVIMPTEPCYARYSGQMEPQEAFLSLDLEEKTLCATYNGEPGNAVPFYVWHGLVRRYGIPATANVRWLREMLSDPELLGMFERLVETSEIYNDGSNWKGRVDEALEEEIIRFLDESFNPERDSILVADGDWWADFIRSSVRADMEDGQLQRMADGEERELEEMHGVDVVFDVDLFDEMQQYRDFLRSKE